SELGDGLPPGGQGDQGEYQVRRVQAAVQDAVALGLGEAFDLFPVVPGAFGDSGGGFAGEAFPLEEAGQLGVAGVIVVGRSGELADVLGQVGGDRGGQPVEFVGEDDFPEGVLVAVVAVEPFFVDAGPACDAGHGGGVVFAFGEF